MMNLPRLASSGSRLLSKLPQSSSVFTTVRVEKFFLSQPAFFSHFCNSNRISGCKLNLVPNNSQSVSYRGLKIRGHLQLRCKDCYFERKEGVLYVMCDSYPRHKQKQLTKREKYTWILTYAFTSKKRPW